MPRKRSPRALVGQAGRYDALLCFNFYVGWRAVQAFYAPCFGPSMNAQRIYVLGMCASDGCTVSAIARELRIDLPAVSSILDRMERDGLVVRMRSPANRREVVVGLSNRGRRVMNDTDRALRAADAVLYGTVTSVEVQTLRRIVAKVEATTLHSS